MRILGARLAWRERIARRRPLGTWRETRAIDMRPVLRSQAGREHEEGGSGPAHQHDISHLPPVRSPKAVGTSVGGPSLAPLPGVPGGLRTRLVPPPQRFVDIRIGVLGVIDFGRHTLSLDASLHDSKLAGYPLTGDLALRLGWGDSPQFLFSLGGFHPHFTPPPGFPALRRLALTAGDNPQLRMDCYLALTSNTAQVGAHADRRARSGRPRRGRQSQAFRDWAATPTVPPGSEPRSGSIPGGFSVTTFRPQRRCSRMGAAPERVVTRRGRPTHDGLASLDRPGPPVVPCGHRGADDDALTPSSVDTTRAARHSEERRPQRPLDPRDRFTPWPRRARTSSYRGCRSTRRRCPPRSCRISARRGRGRAVRPRARRPHRGRNVNARTARVAQCDGAAGRASGQAPPNWLRSPLPRWEPIRPDSASMSLFGAVPLGHGHSTPRMEGSTPASCSTGRSAGRFSRSLSRSPAVVVWVPEHPVSDIPVHATRPATTMPLNRRAR
jgi:Family of unknown function (DUF6603)